MASPDFAAVFERSPNPYMVLDRELRYVAANDAYLRVTASRRDDLLGRHVFEAFPNDPEDPANAGVRDIRASFERVFATGKADVVALIPYRVPRHTPQGTVIEERYWSATHTPLLDEQGKVAFLLQHTVDVTEIERLRQASARDSSAEQVLAGLLDRAELVQAANVSLESERSHLRRLFEQAPGFVAVLGGPTHVFELANRAYREVVGRHDIIGKPLAEAIPELAGQGYLEILDRVFATGEPFVGRGMRVQLVRHPGSAPEEAVVDFVYQPLVDGEGRAVGIFVQGNDITEQARLERERERLVSVLEQSNEFIGTADLGGRAEFVNEAGQRLVGLTAEQVPSTRVVDYFFPEDRPFVENTVLPTVLAAGRWEGELRFRHFVTGEAVPVEWNVFVLKDPRTGAPRGFGTVTRDLTSQRRAEAERDRLSRRERAARADADRAALRQRFLAESIPQQVWTSDPAGKLQFVNRRVLEYYGVEEETLLAHGPWVFIHPEERERCRARWEAVLPTGDVFEFTCRMRRADGVYRWHLIRALALRDGERGIVQWFGTNTDIDEAVQAKESLAERSRFEQQLIGIVSHDLRNPLTSIMLVAQSLLRRQDIDDGTLRAVARIESNAERMTRMIRDLLDFTEARLGGGLKLERRPTDLHRIAEQVVDDVRLVHAGRQIEVHTQEEGAGEWDEDRLAQVLTNLLSNAVKYSPAGTPVKVQSRGEGTDVLLEVHNLGDPIPPEQLARIFEPMQRATAVIDKRSRSVGLGLYIVEQIVKAHGGAVQMTSSQDTGTTVTVRLPRAPRARA